MKYATHQSSGGRSASLTERELNSNTAALHGMPRVPWCCEITWHFHNSTVQRKIPKAAENRELKSKLFGY